MTRNPGRGYLVRRLSAVRVAAPESGRAERDGRRREAVEVRQQRANSDVTFFIRALHSPLVAHLVVVVVTRARIHHRQKDSFHTDRVLHLSGKKEKSKHVYSLRI